MRSEHEFIDSLIHKYKLVISNTQDSQPNHKVAAIRTDIQGAITSRIELYNKMKVQQTAKESEDINQEEFTSLV
jgi:hypothetical protein